MGRKKQQRSAELAERQVERYYTREILSGRLAAGARLPSNQALAEEWATSSTSIQKAFARLAAEGLIERASSRGTFVRDRQERALIGILVGPRMLRDTFWYYRELTGALMEEVESDYLTSRIYDGLSSSELAIGSEIHLRHLQIDRRYFNFSGYLEVSSIQFPPEVRVQDVPRVVQDVQLPENDFAPDYEDCIEELSGRMMRQKFRRVWVVAIYAEGLRQGAISRVAKGVIDRMNSGGNQEARLIGVQVHPAGRDVESATHETILEALASCPRDQWPEAIVGCDDVGMRALIFALLKTGLRVPEDIHLLAIGSEGIDYYYSVPVTIYRFPIRRLAKEMVALLKRRMSGEEVPPEHRLLKGWVEG